MTRNTFLARLHECAKASVRATQNRVNEQLPDGITFHLASAFTGRMRTLNNFLIDEFDDRIDARQTLKFLDAEQVATVLFRDGMVPQWVDAVVAGETNTHTIVELQYCSRFTSDEGILYHRREGRPPFHVAGCYRPWWSETDGRWSIYWNTACWRAGDLRRACANAPRVRVLELNGKEFRDEDLIAAAACTNLEILELNETLVAGAGLEGLSRMPNLRVVRLMCGDIACLDLRILPLLPTVEEFRIDSPPESVLGVERLAVACPNLVAKQGST